MLELSSYQIDLTHSLDCDVAVLLNVTPDHLDRYDGFEAYAASKARLFAMQSAGHDAVIAIEDDHSRAIAERIRSRRYLVSSAGREGPVALAGAAGAAQRAERARRRSRSRARSASPTRSIARGARNLSAACRTGWSGSPSRTASSSSTTARRPIPNSTAPALAAFPAIHWIVGGLAKTDDLGRLRGPARPCPRRLHDRRGRADVRRAARGHRCRSANASCWSTAVGDAAEAAAPGEVVLLSPACASFDQFRDYEARGDAFRAAVEALA